MKPKFTDADRFKHANYDPSHSTDVRKRFERIAKARKALEKAQAEADAEAAVKVETLPKRRTA